MITAAEAKDKTDWFHGVQVSTFMESVSKEIQEEISRGNYSAEVYLHGIDELTVDICSRRLVKDYGYIVHRKFDQLTLRWKD